MVNLAKVATAEQKLAGSTGPITRELVAADAGEFRRDERHRCGIIAQNQTAKAARRNVRANEIAAPVRTTLLRRLHYLKSTRLHGGKEHSRRPKPN